MSKISPHDEYFRAVFTEDTVRDFISGFFPKGLADNLVLKTLTRTAESYVDKQLKASYADLVFHCN